MKPDEIVLLPETQNVMLDSLLSTRQSAWQRRAIEQEEREADKFGHRECLPGNCVV